MKSSSMFTGEENFYDDLEKGVYYNAKSYIASGGTLKGVDLR